MWCVSGSLESVVMEQLVGKAIDTAVKIAVEFPSGNSDKLSSGEGYDFEIEIPNMKSIVDGWCFKVSSQSHDYFKENGQSLNIQNVVSVIGYYSKGKSFIVNKLFNAGQGLLDDGYIYSAADPENVATGAGVTSVGITGILVGHGSGPISDATTIILDCAGRNAPTNSFKDGTCKSSSPTDKLEIVKEEINNMRAKERLLDDVAIDVADVIFYVMDELLNEDQRMILFMIEENSKMNNPKKIVILHNFKRQKSCYGSDKQLKSFLKTQIEDTFGANLMASQRNDIFTKNYPNIHEWGLWTSHWPVSDSRTVTVTHAVIFEDVSCKNVNKDMFKYLSATFIDGKQDNFNIRHDSFLEVLADSFSSRVGDFLTFSDAPKDLTTKKTVSMKKSSCNKFALKDIHNKVAKLHSWELRELPPGDYNGEFEPNSDVFLTGKDDKYHVVMLDLPGMNSSDEIGCIDPNEPPPPKDTKSWYRLNFTSGDYRDPNNYKTIDGYYKNSFSNQKINQKTKQHGYFEVKFPVPSKYTSNSLHFEHGRLMIASCKPQTDHRGNAIPCDSSLLFMNA